jgi:hypothetical protein
MEVVLEPAQSHSVNRRRYRCGATSENNPLGQRSLSLAGLPRFCLVVTLLAEQRKQARLQGFALQESRH